MFKFLKTATTAGLASLALLCTSCSTALPIVGAITTITGGGGIQCSVPLTVAKAYYGFEAGYQGVALTLSQIAGTSLLPTGSPTALQIKAKYQDLIQIRHGVEAAVDACNSTSLAGQVQAGQNLVDDLQALILSVKGR